MSVQTRRRKNSKTFFVRAVCMTLAVLMLMSVVLAAVWRW